MYHTHTTKLRVQYRRISTVAETKASVDDKLLRLKCKLSHRTLLKVFSPALTGNSSGYVFNGKKQLRVICIRRYKKFVCNETKKKG